MYPNIRAAMARAKLGLKDLASDPRIHCTVSTMSLKLSGKAEFTFGEAIAVKSILGSDMPLEVLFQTEEG